MKYINSPNHKVIRIGKKIEFGKSLGAQHTKPYFATFTAGSDAYIIYRSTNLFSALWLAFKSRLLNNEKYN